MLIKRQFSLAAVCLLVLALIMSPVNLGAAEKPFIFGLLLVGPHNDHGPNQAQLQGGQYVVKTVPGTKMIFIARVNPPDRQGVTIAQLVDDMVEKGARLIIANSAEMQEGIREAALVHPKIHFVHITGDDVRIGRASANLSNLMGRMEYGKMIAGFVAALTTKTGKIGYLGPLINSQSRRLAASAYLGAKYAWVKVRKKPAKDLNFKVTWIGFWFNLPGVTADPTEVAHSFYDTGHDVVISGIDTPEAAVAAVQKKKEGKPVWAIPYGFAGACEDASDVCLGVPYFNWGPGYVKFVKASMSGNWNSVWDWLGPVWTDFNNLDTSAVGFLPGPALSAIAKKKVDGFIGNLGSGKINLFKGPLNYQDSTVFVKTGEIAGDQRVWYMEQLLEGMSGLSSAK